MSTEATTPEHKPGGAVSSAKFNRIRPARAVDEIASQIRAELASGTLHVGSRLPSERVLSEQFGVSRNTLREALRSLEHAGLIQLRKGASGGAFISEGSGEAITTGLMDMYHLGSVRPDQLTEARLWLESIVVREACRRRTDEGIAELERNLEEAREAALKRDYTLGAEKHIDFHRILARMTGNPIMVIVMSAVLDVLSHFVSQIGPCDNTFVEPSRRRFMKHFKAGDEDAAVGEMEKCLQRLQRKYLSRLQETVTVARDVRPDSSGDAHSSD